MSVHPVWQTSFAFFAPAELTVTVSDSQLTSDAGLLVVREFDHRIGLTSALAAAISDPRAPKRVHHEVAEMVRARLFGILAGYEDQNDHDLLRHDPVFKLIADRRPGDGPLAAQPTLSRFENRVDIPSLKRLRTVLLEQFVASFPEPPSRLTLDLDAMDDPCHGHQQLALFHGYYGQYQYLPLLISCEENQQFVLCQLRHGTAAADLGAADDLELVVTHLRRAWPDVEIVVRGDCGFGRPEMYEVCERLELTYTFGLAANAVLKRASESLLTTAVTQQEETNTPQRIFDTFFYRAESWPFPRRVIVKAEANSVGTNRRFVVTNRPGAGIFPEGTYDEYIRRGESENRHKELKCGLFGGRLSDHRFLANFFRLYLHVFAHVLLVRLRQGTAERTCSDVHGEVPPEAATGVERRLRFNHRRRRDPLGNGQPATWRTLLIKVAAEVTQTARRVWVRISGSWPFLSHLQAVCTRLSPAPA